MRGTRLALGGLGLLVLGWGVWLLLSRQDLAQVSDVAVWLLAGAVLHDAVLAPLVLALAWLVRRRRDALRRPLVVALVVTGSLSLLAVPVLGRFGARPDNPTLLDRPYLASWLGLLGLTALGVVVATAAGTVARRRDPAQEGRRHAAQRP